MTLDQMKILVKIADTGSVLAAAQVLHRTQPTVSVSMQKLENEINVILLDRRSYRAKLTQEGWQLYRKAKAVLRRVEEFSSLAHYLSSGHESELHLAIEASCPMPLLLEILHASEQKYPQRHST